MSPTRFRAPRVLAGAALILALTLWVAAVASGGFMLQQREINAGLTIIALATGVLLLALILQAGIILLHRSANLLFRNYDLLLDLVDLARRRTDQLRAVAENSALSDWAKKIVFREKDHDFLRDAIQSMIVREEWEAVEQFIRTLETEFNQKQEAGVLRAQVAKARAATVDERITAATQRLESLCDAQKWEQATRECARLRVLFPDDTRIDKLDEQISNRRRQYKNFLLKEYDQAIRVHDIDGAHRLLLELDRYLTPSEGAALKESARGVFRAKLLQEGVQFSLAVSDRQFEKAIEIGDRICKEFPNSRYANEIRAMIPLLRKRANGAIPSGESTLREDRNEPVGAR